MFNTIIIDNFFDNFHILEEEFKKIPLLSLNEYPDIKDDGISWPGKRSLPLLKINPFLWQLTVKEIMQKSENRDLVFGSWRMNASLHLRLKEDDTKDYIHKDPDYLTMIVFLAKTNFKSGLNIYDEEKNETTNIKYQQNRAVLFDSKKFHKSASNFGNDINDGRLTLNCFINFDRK